MTVMFLCENEFNITIADDEVQLFTTSDLSEMVERINDLKKLIF